MKQFKLTESLNFSTRRLYDNSIELDMNKPFSSAEEIKKLCEANKIELDAIDDNDFQNACITLDDYYSGYFAHDTNEKMYIWIN